MPARSPEEICRLFQQFMAAGDIESLLSLYDPQAVILGRSREMQRGSQGAVGAHGCREDQLYFPDRSGHPGGRHGIDAYALDRIFAGAYLRTRN